MPIGALVLAAPAAGSEVRSHAAAVAPADAASGAGIAISTCHRVEIYVEPQALERLARHEPWRAARRLDGQAAVRHAISLAAGLESAVLGEDQVLHQFRLGVAAARARGDVSGPIELLADHALRAGRIARSWRPARARSLAMGGFWVVKAEDLDDALRWAAKGSAACKGPVEVRPFQDEPEN